MLQRLAVETGRIGELFAAGIIEQFGWRTAFCQQSGVDLLMWQQDRFYRVQVKASNKHKGVKRLQFHFGIGRQKRKPTDEFELVCCVSIPHRRAFFVPIQDIDVITLSRSTDFFDRPEIEKESFNYTIESLQS